MPTDARRLLLLELIIAGITCGAIQLDTEDDLRRLATWLRHLCRLLHMTG